MALSELLYEESRIKASGDRQVLVEVSIGFDKLFYSRRVILTTADVSEAVVRLIPIFPLYKVALFPAPRLIEPVDLDCP